MNWSTVDGIAQAGPLRAVEQVRVEQAGDGYSVAARVRIDPHEPVLRGHFPGLPLYPGVFIVETLCQAMTAALGKHGHRPRLREVRTLRLIAALHGGDELSLDVAVSRGDGGWIAKAVGYRRDGETAATVRATFDEQAEGERP